MHKLSAALVIALLVACSGSDGSPSVAFGEPPYAAVELAGAPVEGSADAWVTVVEFVDYACPACARAAPALEQLLANHPDDVRVAFKMFPLPTHQPGSGAAARAALCAAAQGRFPEMHASLFEHQASFAPEQLRSYAAALGLDLATWDACYASQATANAVAADFAEGDELGVPGTPTFFMNGKLLDSGPDALEHLFTEARAAAEASGVPRAEYYDRVVLGR